jgi:hypothetical protein
LRPCASDALLHAKVTVIDIDPYYTSAFVVCYSVFM